MAGYTPHCVAHVSVDSERSNDRAYIQLCTHWYKTYQIVPRLLLCHVSVYYVILRTSWFIFFIPFSCQVVCNVHIVCNLHTRLQGVYMFVFCTMAICMETSGI